MLQYLEVEWIWWMDLDVMFMDMFFEFFIDKYKDYNMVLYGFDEMVYKMKSWVGFNIGSFFLCNCQWFLDLLDVWVFMGFKGVVCVEVGKQFMVMFIGCLEFEVDDQSVFIFLLVIQVRLWVFKVFLENQYYLYGYWVILVECYEEMMQKNKFGIGDD